MMRRALIVLLAVFAIALGLIFGLAVRQDPDLPDGSLTASEAAAALRTSAGFLTREDSPVGRELVDVLFVRRIARTATEVEFTWRDVPPDGSKSPTLRTSLALFRNTDGRQWVLTSLYKVD
jgi:hypothetical protein